MPYKDKEAAKEASRERMARHRAKAVTPAGNVTPVVTPDPLDGWKDVEAYILRDSPRMGNLERLQRIAGSLGKRSGDVWFGVTGLTMEDIGSVIGTQEPLYGR